MKVLVAPDSFGGTLSSIEAARAITLGWRRARSDDEVVSVPLADGGEGTIDVLARSGDKLTRVEVADPLGRPRLARFLLRDGLAVVESAEACGLKLLAPAERDPLRTTTYGVGQLLEAARRAGVRRIAVGLGGSATVDGGAGASTALGMRILRHGGGGLKIGGGELTAVTAIAPRWLDPGWESVDVELWADVDTVLIDAAPTFGPQKGATPEAVARLQAGLGRWAEVVEHDLGGHWRDLPGSGAAGGLGFGLAAVLDARLVAGAPAVAELVGLQEGLQGADLLVTGEGLLDATSMEGKVVGHVLALGQEAGLPVVAVVGRVEAEGNLADIEPAAAEGPGPDPGAEVSRAARRLAQRMGY